MGARLSLRFLPQVDVHAQSFFRPVHEINWKFNLSHALWWCGQFERLIGVVKLAMHNFIGGRSTNLGRTQ